MTANLWQLFLSFMQVGMFSIGGGYAAMPFIRSQVVSLHGWLTMSEFTDLVTIAEMTPGPIAVNAATFVGNRLAGFTGAIVATMGCILPSCLIVSLLAYLYRKYRQMDMLQNVLTCLRPAVVALAQVEPHSGDAAVRRCPPGHWADYRLIQQKSMAAGSFRPPFYFDVSKYVSVPQGSQAAPGAPSPNRQDPASPRK